MVDVVFVELVVVVVEVNVDVDDDVVVREHDGIVLLNVVNGVYPFVTIVMLVLELTFNVILVATG